jgi:hypothetical protein
MVEGIMQASASSQGLMQVQQYMPAGVCWSGWPVRIVQMPNLQDMS